MKINFDFRHAQKEGNAPSEYEDAFAPIHEQRIEVDRFKCALSDGASEATHAGDWAKILVESFVAGTFNDPGSLATSLPQLADEWGKSIHNTELSWFEKEKLTQGAYATFLGLELNNHDAKTWQCHAIGDTCLFHKRGPDVLSVFPLTRPEEFSNHPDLVGSRIDGASARSLCKPLAGEWKSEDQFILATDALACCLIRQLADDNSEFALLVELLFEDFSETVRHLRNQTLPDGSSKLKNDDVSLLRVQVSE